MCIKIVGIAFAITLIAMIGFAGFGTSGTAEASIHNIVESQCAAQDSQSGNSGAPEGRTAGQNRHPPGSLPGFSASDASNFAGQNNSNANATNGEEAANCTNPSPTD